MTSFVGRERELAEVRELLGSTRLLTLLGAGGLGKTRLSLQVAADVMDDYPDGVWFVELAPLADPRLVPQAVASVLGVKEEAGRPVSEALVKYVGDRRLLLVLDNCEHLRAGLRRARRARCCRRAPQLEDPGVEPRAAARGGRDDLSRCRRSAVPDPHRAVPLDALAQYEAVRLFIDRAVAAQPAFAVTGENAPAIADICQRLDGIPLAIELAAARVRALSVEQIAARLTDRFRLLTRRRPDRAAAPADAARADRLELRPAHRARARAVPAPRGVRRRLDARSGGSRGRRRRRRWSATCSIC